MSTPYLMGRVPNGLDGLNTDWRHNSGKVCTKEEIYKMHPGKYVLAAKGHYLKIYAKLDYREQLKKKWVEDIEEASLFPYEEALSYLEEFPPNSIEIKRVFRSLSGES